MSAGWSRDPRVCAVVLGGGGMSVGRPASCRGIRGESGLLGRPFGAPSPCFSPGRLGDFLSASPAEVRDGGTPSDGAVLSRTNAAVGGGLPTGLSAGGAARSPAGTGSGSAPSPGVRLGAGAAGEPVFLLHGEEVEFYVKAKRVETGGINKWYAK